MSSPLTWMRRVTMPDDTVWDVPVDVIARDRARYYHENHPDEFPTFDDALAETVREFYDDYEIEDWASNNMNWKEVSALAVRVPSKPKRVDYQEGWTNGESEIVKI